MKRTLRTLALLAVATGCSVPDPTLLASVGNVEIHVADLEGARGAAGQRRLQELIAEAQAAEVAHEQGLQRRSEVQAALERARRKVLARALIDERDPPLDESALRRLYKERQDDLAIRELDLAHIVVRAERPSDQLSVERARERAWQRASALYARVRSGVDFDVVAREASEDPATASRGGLVGIVREGSVDRAYFERAAQLKVDEVSPPFETRFGFFIIKARSDPREVVPPFEQVRGTLSATATREARAKLQEELDRAVVVERRQAAIDKLLREAE